MADSDLTTGATVAGELGAGVSGTDARLKRLIRVVSDAILRYLQRSAVHYNGALTEYVAGYGRSRLLLERSPIISIASITLPDGSTVDPSEYRSINDDALIGAVYRDFSWPDTSLLRPGIVQQDPDPGTNKQSIVVVYAGGWPTPNQAPAYSAITGYVLNQLVQPSDPNGFAYICTTAGAAGAEPASWPTTAGSTVVGGGSTFTLLGKALPNDIEQACIMGTIGLWRARGKYSRYAEETTTGDLRPMYDYALPFNARQLLDTYKRLR